MAMPLVEIFYKIRGRSCIWLGFDEGGGGVGVRYETGRAGDTPL